MRSTIMPLVTGVFFLTREDEQRVNVNPDVRGVKIWMVVKPNSQTQVPGCFGLYSFGFVALVLYCGLHLKRGRVHCYGLNVRYGSSGKAWTPLQTVSLDSEALSLKSPRISAAGARTRHGGSASRRRYAKVHASHTTTTNLPILVKANMS